MKFKLPKNISIFKSRIVISWLLSYLVVFAVPIFGSLYIYSRSENQLEQQIYEMDNKMLEAMQNSVDSAISNQPALLTSLSRNIYINELLNERNINESKKKAMCTKIALAIRENKFYASDISDIYLYFNKYDIFISGTCVGSPEEFFSYYYSKDNNSYDEWYNNFKTQHYAGYSITTNSAGEQLVEFLYSYPINSIGIPDFTVSFAIDKSVFQNIVSSYDNFKNKTVYILDPNNRVISIIGENHLPSLPESILSGEPQIQRNGDYCFISRISQMNRWKYISVTPNAYINGQLSYMRSVIMLNLAVCLIIGLLLVYFFVKKNYKPINNLITICKNTDKISDGKNEFELIRELLEDYTDTKAQYSSILRDKNAFQKNAALEALVKGDITENVRGNLEKYDVSFISDFFAVIVFKITNAEVLFSDDEMMNADKRAEMIHFIMGNVLEEIIARKHRGYLAEVDGQIIMIVSLNKDNLGNYKDDIYSGVQEAKEFIESNFMFSFIAAMSDLHQGFANIADAFAEAKQTLQYRSFINKTQIVSYEEINQNENKLSYTSEKDRQLINFIRLGNYEAAKELADKITDEVFAGAQIGHIRLITFNLINTIITAVTENDLSDTDLRKLFSYIGGTSEYKDYNEFSDNIHKLLSYACNTVKSHSAKKSEVNKLVKSSAEDLVEKIKKYIAENYTDNSLNIASIGDYFDITPYYASNIFKNAENISMLDYIGKYRVEAAKKLIEESDISISEAALKAGFNNARTFTRAFVKYEGITPGQYKEMLGQ